MNTLLLRLVMILALGVFGFAGVGCDTGADDEGPLEEAGRELDQAAEEAGETADQAGEELNREIDEAQQEAEGENP